MIDAGVLVIGTGAVGGVTAGLMTGNVARVVALDANPEHVERLRGPGLRIDVLGEERVVVLDAHASVDELAGPFDFGLITLKAPNIPDVLPALQERGLVDVFVSLGNGLVQQRVAAIVGADRLIAGTVEFGATNLGPGHVSQTTRNPYVIGELDGPIRERTQRLRDVLATVAEVRLTDNIQGQIWSKLLVNSGLSGLGVVGGVLYRDVIEDPAGRAALLAVWGEGCRVGAAQGLELDEVLGIEPAALRGRRRAGGGRGAADRRPARRGDEGLDAPGRRARAAHGGRRHQRRRRGSGRANSGSRPPPTRRSSSSCTPTSAAS